MYNNFHYFQLKGKFSKTEGSFLGTKLMIAPAKKELKVFCYV